MSVPNSEKWKAISDAFFEKWNFPNCVGAIDGKHVVLQAPPSSGSAYFNYKGTHSIVLMAVVDADYKFVLIDVGAYGRNSDGGIFANSAFGQSFLSNTLDIPANQPLPYTQQVMPLTIVGDEAFPLKPNIMRPFGGKNLPEIKRIFNYRLSRARRVSENAFGILSNRWRIFRRLIHGYPSSVELYVKASCILHNYLMHQNPVAYTQQLDSDNDTNANNVSTAGNLNHYGSNHSSKSAIAIRDAFADYFVSPAGEVPWQYSQVREGL
jgi:hypothetical protein